MLKEGKHKKESEKKQTKDRRSLYFASLLSLFGLGFVCVLSLFSDSANSETEIFNTQ
jgi:hypothetical protein